MRIFRQLRQLIFIYRVKLLRIKYNQIDKIPSILNEELLNVI